uniref:Rhodanese domain-containing protein n=1 Tax=Ditylenchus dipsaci TaxID=166011 RepID=A0A915DV31_9BILA
MMLQQQNPQESAQKLRPSSLVLPRQCRPSSHLFLDLVMDSSPPVLLSTTPGGFFGFQKQFPELCESSAQLRKSSSVSGQQSATTPFPPATAGCLLLQQHPTRFNCNNNSFSTPSDVNGNLSFKLAMEGQRAPQIESQQLLGACAPSNNCSTSKVMLRGNSSQQQNGLATAPLL